MAVLHPLQGAVEVHPRRSLEGAAVAAERVAGGIDRVTVDRERRDATVVSTVANHAVGHPWQRRPAHGVDRSQTVAGVVRPVQGREAAADDHLAAVRGQGECIDGATGGDGRPREQGSVFRGHCSGTTAGCAVQRRREAAQVDRVGRGDNRPDAGVRDGGKCLDDRACGGVQRNDAVLGLSVDGREVAADIDPGSVGGGGDDVHFGVGRRCPAVDQYAGAHVVCQQVGPGHGVDAWGGSGRPGCGEVTTDVHRVADNLLCPHDTVDLNRRERVYRRGLRVRRVIGHWGSRVCVCRPAQLEHADDERRGQARAQGPRLQESFDLHFHPTCLVTGRTSAKVQLNGLSCPTPSRCVFWPRPTSAAPWGARQGKCSVPAGQ